MSLKKSVLLAMLVFFLSVTIFVSCGDDDDDDSIDSQKCDNNCEEGLYYRALSCNLDRNNCMGTCDENADCESECLSEWTACLDYTSYNSCVLGCGGCSGELQTCQEGCESDLCDETCLDDFYDCSGWDRDCFDACTQTYNQCATDCEDYSCLNDCDEQYYGQCQPGCLS